MLDMLTAARDALGFWGAHQVVMELERLSEGSRGFADRLRADPPTANVYEVSA